MRRVARFVYVAYAVVFLVSGLASALLAHLEMLPFLGIEEGTPDLLNQYRFLRAVELGFGLLMWTLREEFFSDARLARPLVVAFFAIPAARGVGFLVDGMPGMVFQFLICAEVAIAVFLTWQSALVSRAGVQR